MPKSFQPPPDLVIPEGIAEGAEMEFMAGFKVERDGKMTLVSIDGLPIPGYEDKPKPGITRYVGTDKRRMEG